MNPVEKGIQTAEIECEITKILHRLGVTERVSGFQYLRTAILLVIEKPEVIKSVTKAVYPYIAEKYGVTTSQVQRGIRYGIEVACDRGDLNLLISLFGRSWPTPTEFIVAVADNVKKNLNLL